MDHEKLFDYTTIENQFSPNKVSNIEQPQTDTSTYLLTQKVPLLLESVDFQTIDNGTRVVLKSIEKSLYFEAILDKTLMKNFVDLILRSAPKYEWGVYNI